MDFYSPAIIFHRGDSCPLTLVFRVSGEPYIMQPGDTLYFGVFKGRRPIVVKSLTADQQTADGWIHGRISPEDTAALRPGEYEYEIELISAENGPLTAPRGLLLLEEDRMTPEVRAMVRGEEGNGNEN